MEDEPEVEGPAIEMLMNEKTVLHVLAGLVRKSISIVGKKGVYCVEELVDIYVIYEPTREHVLTFKGEIVGIYGPEDAVDALPGEPPHVILKKMLKNRLRLGTARSTTPWTTGSQK